MLASSFSSKIHSSIIECLTQRQGKKNEEVEEKVSLYIPVWVQRERFRWERREIRTTLMIGLFFQARSSTW